MANFDWLIEEKIFQGFRRHISKLRQTKHHNLQQFRTQKKHSIYDEKIGGIENDPNKRDKRHICTEYPE